MDELTTAEHEDQGAPGQGTDAGAMDAVAQLEQSWPGEDAPAAASDDEREATRLAESWPGEDGGGEAGSGGAHNVSLERLSTPEAMDRMMAGRSTGTPKLKDEFSGFCDTRGAREDVDGRPL